MTDVEAAWLAGFIDADGSIGCYIAHSSKRSTGKKYTTHKIRLQATNCNPEVIQRLHQIAGIGSVATDKHGPDNWKRRYVWEVTGANAVYVLGRIGPYMIAKRQQAVLAVSFPLRNGQRETPPSVLAQREAIRSQLLALNRRGV